MDVLIKTMLDAILGGIISDQSKKTAKSATELIKLIDEYRKLKRKPAKQKHKENAIALVNMFAQDMVDKKVSDMTASELSLVYHKVFAFWNSLDLLDKDTDHKKFVEMFLDSAFINISKPPNK